MFDFIHDSLGVTSQILMLAFVSLLILLCVRTRSKGLIIITVVLVIPFGFILNLVVNPYIDQWGRGELDDWLTQRITVGRFAVLYQTVKGLLHKGLLALGAFLLYREWSRGKIRCNRDKSPEIVNHA